MNSNVSKSEFKNLNLKKEEKIKKLFLNENIDDNRITNLKNKELIVIEERESNKNRPKSDFNKNNIFNKNEQNQSNKDNSNVNINNDGMNPKVNLSLEDFDDFKKDINIKISHEAEKIYKSYFKIKEEIKGATHKKLTECLNKEEYTENYFKFLFNAMCCCKLYNKKHYLIVNKILGYDSYIRLSGNQLCERLK